MPTKHYKFGGSTAGRTIACPAWIPLAEKMPEQEPDGFNPHADRGTLLHDCMEDLLLDPDKDAQDFLGRKGLNDAVVTQDDIDDALHPALMAYVSFADAVGIDVEIPEFTMEYTKDIGGTADVIAANDDTVFILDWKFGFNYVDPEENAQGLFYAMCAMDDSRLKDLFKTRKQICIVIIQPTTDEVISTWYTDVERVNDFAQEHGWAVLDVKQYGADLKPVAGEHCKFCPAEAICPLKNGMARKALMLDPNTMTSDELGANLAIADELTQWIRSVQKLAHEQLELGGEVKGYKLVDKRATRKWKNEDEVLELVKKARKLKLDEACDVKLKSPTQLEKVCKKKDIDFDKYDAYTEKVSSGTTIAPDNDKRPKAINTRALADAIVRAS